MLYKMALKMVEFDINYITAVGGKSVNGLKFANFRYKNFDRFPRIIVYGGMKVMQGKFGNYFELDIKDDKAKEFFKSLEKTLLRVGGGCLCEKPWNIKSPLINYGGFYTVRCKIYPNSRLGNLKVGRYECGYCEITPYRAFIGKQNGVTIIVNKVLIWLDRYYYLVSI